MTAGSADPAAIQAEIEATRARLGRTVDEIGARLDVRAHAREKAFVARDTVVETYRESPPAVVGGALALVGLVVGLVVWRRKRATRRRKR
jgi:hypothetical protein